jgi:hypothetical protein
MRIFWSKRDEVIGGQRKLHNEKLHNLYSSPNINQMIKSKRMRCVVHVACMGEERNVEDRKTRMKETAWKTKASIGA